jgi:hypothetical protein
MASAVLLALAFSAILSQLADPPDGDSGPSAETPVSARISVNPSIAAAPASGHAQDELGLSSEVTGQSPWPGWVWLDGKRVSAESSDPSVRVLASRVPGGVAVAVANPGSAPALLRLEVKMPSGRYTIERLLFGPEGCRTERLQCLAQQQTGWLQKPGYLAAGTVAVYRFVDYASTAEASYRRAAERARAYRTVSASQSARLLAALRECPWMLTRARQALMSGDALPALPPIHRALLAVRHAQAVCGNAPASGTAARALRDRIASELDTLEDALGECSVAALGLVPSAWMESEASDDSRQSVHIRVRNAGSQSVSAVKLWLTGPSGCIVEPTDQAVFGTLRPGQAATAEYSAHMASKQANADTEALANPRFDGLVAHLSYYRDQAPAHVRIMVR